MKHLIGIPNNLKQGLSEKLATLLTILCGLKKYLFENDVVIILIGDLLKSIIKNFILVKLNFQAIMIRQFIQWKF